MAEQVRRRQWGEQRAETHKNSMLKPPTGGVGSLFESLLPKGQLIGPGGATGNNMRLRLSVIDEHFFSAGAAPAGGAGFWEVLRRGPCSWGMFVSCVGFVVPGLIHLWKLQHMADALAGVSLMIVAITSTLCDSFFQDNAVYDEAPYERTARAIGASTAVVADAIKESGAEPEVLANDGWNNFTRAVDRGWAALVTAPCSIYYMCVQRPSVQVNLPFVGWALLAFLAVNIGQHFRKKDPSGCRYMRGAYVVERNFQTFMVMHQIWHLLLIVALTASAIYRPLL